MIDLWGRKTVAGIAVRSVLGSGFVVILLATGGSLVACEKKELVSITYDQEYVIPSYMPYTFPGVVGGGMVSSVNGVWVVYRIRTIGIFGSDAGAFQLNRDSLTTQNPSVQPPPQSFSVPEELQKNLTELPPTLDVFPGPEKQINNRVVLFAPGKTQDQINDVYIDLKYYSPKRSVFVGRHSPVVHPKVLPKATWKDLQTIVQ